MSNNVNQELMERANELMEEYSGTLWERVIQRDIDDGDLEALKYHVSQAEAQSQLENDAELGWLKETE